MSDLEKQRNLEVHRQKLFDLGFPEWVIGDAVEANKEGLFDKKPSPDLLEMTAAACAALVKEKNSQSRS